MALAGHAVEVYGDLTTAPANEIDGIKSVSYGPSRDMLEETDFKDTSGAHKRFAGLKDGAISISGDYEAADLGIVDLFTAFDTGVSYFFGIAWNGVTGHEVECLVESVEIAADFDGNVTFSASLTFNGAPIAFTP